MILRYSHIVIGMFYAGAALAGDFSVTSVFKPGTQVPHGHVFNNFGCTGGNISPALNWTRAPAGTKSFAVTLYDPDVQTGSGWWHWVVFNIPAEVMSLASNAGSPTANLAPRLSVQSRTDFGTPGYGGPCPPAGDKPHRYQFTVYALNTEMLPLDKEASGALVGYYLHQNLIEKTVLEAFYSRPAITDVGEFDVKDEGAHDLITEFGGNRSGDC